MSTNCLYYKNGNVKYQGEMKANQYHGCGKAFAMNGNLVYDGEWFEGEKCGSGSSYDDLKGKLLYSGEWKGDRYHGRGTEFQFDDVPLYDGEWVEGLRHGRGKLYNPRGELEFEGEFEDGSPKTNDFVAAKQAPRQTNKASAPLAATKPPTQPVQAYVPCGNQYQTDTQNTLDTLLGKLETVLGDIPCERARVLSGLIKKEASSQAAALELVGRTVREREEQVALLKLWLKLTVQAYEFAAAKPREEPGSQAMVELQEKYNQTRSMCNKYQSARDRAWNQCEVLQRENGELKAECDSLQQENGELKVSQQNLQAECSSLRAECASLAAALAESERLRASQKDAVQKMRSELNEARQRAERVTKAAELRDKQIEEIKNKQIAAIKIEIDKHVAEIRGKQSENFVQRFKADQIKKVKDDFSSLKQLKTTSSAQNGAAAGRDQKDIRARNRELKERHELELAELGERLGLDAYTAGDVCDQLVDRFPEIKDSVAFVLEFNNRLDSAQDVTQDQSKIAQYRACLARICAATAS